MVKQIDPAATFCRAIRYASKVKFGFERACCLSLIFGFKAVKFYHSNSTTGFA